MKNKSSTPQRKLKQTKLLDFSSPPSTSRPAPSSSRPKGTQRKKFKQPAPTLTFNVSDDDDSSDGINHIKLERPEPIEISDSSDSKSESESSEEERAPIPSPQKRSLKLQNYESNSEEEQRQRPIRAKASTSKRRLQQLQDSEEDSEGEAAPKRRRLTRNRKTPAKEDVGSNSEDVDDLDEEYILESRFRDRGKKSAFQKNLEKLKRRKQKQPLPSSDSEGSEQAEAPPAKVKPFKGARPGAKADSLFGSDRDEDGSTSEEEEDEEDFIVEDDPLAAPLLPAEFSMETHQDLSHQFKKVFQFFVHIAAQPSNKRRKFMETNMDEEEYFSVPLTVTRRKLDGLRDSLVASSVWRPQFKKALETYPEFSLTALGFTIPECDACHLGRRISTLDGCLSGEPYDRMGFRRLKKKPQSDSDSDSDSEEEHLKKQFNLGRFCGRRTEVFHQFCHWEYDLFNAIDKEIEELRNMEKSKKGKKFYKIAYAGGKKPPEDLTDADALCEWLDERQIIDFEWKKVKAMMESARHLELEGKNGDAD